MSRGVIQKVVTDGRTGRQKTKFQMKSIDIKILIMTNYRKN